MADSNPLIHLVVKDKNGLIHEDDVRAVTSYNEKGIFDILPMHTNFISLIKDKIIIHGRSGEDKKIDLRVGLVKVDDNQVHIYLGLPEPIEPENSDIATLKS